MKGMAIQGVGVVGGFGCGTGELLEALNRGFVSPTEVCPVPGDESLKLPVYHADHKPLEKFLNKRALRRIDHFSRLALLGAYLALEDADLLEVDHGRTAVVIASGYGPTATTFSFLDSVMDDGDSCASPTHFSNSVHNAAAAHVAIQLKAKGPSLTVSQFEMSTASALLSARQILSEGRADRVLFGAVDEYCAVLGYCLERFFGAPASKTMEPLDFQRQTAIAGEGAAFFLLTRDEEAPYGAIEELGLANLRGGLPSLSDEAVYFLGADGHRRCSEPYSDLVSPSASVAAYAPLYGSFPTGMAFDLAVAALTCRAGCLWDLPCQGTKAFEWKNPGGECLGGRKICCLKTGSTGEYGFLTLT